MSTHLQRLPVRRRLHLGGSRGNEVLTSIDAALLVTLIAVQLVTVLALGSMIRVHLFVGVVLLGPVALKLGATGYRFARYYTGSSEYRQKGPPQLLLRALGPVFVAATFGLFASGVVMLVEGSGEGFAHGVHAASFWIWMACLIVHVGLHTREVLDSLRSEWLKRARVRIAGAELRAMLVLSSVLGGVLVALALISYITGYHMSD